MPESTNTRSYDAGNCDLTCLSPSRGVEHTIEFFSNQDEEEVPCTVDCESCSASGSCQDTSLGSTLCVSVIVDDRQEDSGSDEGPGKGESPGGKELDPKGGDDTERGKAQGSDEASGKGESPGQEESNDPGIGKAQGSDVASGKVESPSGEESHKGGEDPRRVKDQGSDEAQGPPGGSNIVYGTTTTKESCLQEPKQLSSGSDSDDDIYDIPDTNQQRTKLLEERPFQAMNSDFFVDTTSALTKTFEDVVFPKQPVVNPPRESVCNAVVFNRGFGTSCQNPRIESTHQVSYAYNQLSLSVDGNPLAKVAVDNIGCLNLAQAIEKIIPEELVRFSALMATLVQTLIQQGLRRFSIAFRPSQLGPGQPLLDTDPTPTVFDLPPTGLDTMHQGVPDLRMDTWATDLPSMGIETGATGFPNQGWQ